MKNECLIFAILFFIQTFIMKRNIGKTDKLIRILLALALGLVVSFKVVTGVAATIFLLIAAVLLLTALINFCPIWHFSGISTKEKTNQSHHNQST